MNYEQLNIYFGPPGMCAFIPVRHVTPAMVADPAFLSYTLEMHRPTWREVFAQLRRFKKALSKEPFTRHATGVIFRTGVLRPTSAEGENMRGAVIMHNFRFDQPLGPTMLELHRVNYITVRHWSTMPKYVPYPPWDDKLPELCSVWYAGYATNIIQNAPVADWEELL